MVDEAKFIADSIEDLEASVCFFSSKSKSERERWVVDKLLENMNIPHNDNDIVSPDQDPPDVLALGGRFEIKEILDEGRKRHKEYKDSLIRAKTISNPHDLLTTFTPVPCSVQEIFQYCCEEINKLQKKYPANLRSNMDLLFYVNLRHIFTIDEIPFPDITTLTSCGWRSISFIQGEVACCFYASPDAPSWLQTDVGQLQRKKWA